MSVGVLFKREFLDRFGFRDRIRFRTEVTRVEPAAGGGWTVSWRQTEGSGHAEVLARQAAADGIAPRPVALGEGGGDHGRERRARKVGDGESQHRREIYGTRRRRAMFRRVGR